MGEQGNAIRVLHVDDDAQRTAATKRVIEDLRENIAVATETRVETGLTRLAEESFDCVVSDYEMPDRDGLAFLDAVREKYPDLPFILFTGKGSEEIASEAISAGVTDYLQKGNGIDSYRILSDRIENAVAKREAEAEARNVHRAMEAARAGISLLDDEGRFTYVNQAYADLYGYDPDAMVGERWGMIYPDFELERVNEEILPAVRGTGTWRGETTGLRYDGSTFVEDHTLARRDDGGLVCAVRDVTDRLDESDERPSPTTEILDTSDVGTIVLGPDSRVVWMNEAIEEYFGIERSSVLGRDQTDVVHEMVKDRVANPEEYARKVLSASDDDRRRFECHVRETPETDERWLEHWSQPIESGPYAGGRVKHYEDVTDRKRKQAELERQKRALERQNERLDEFASVLSHDLRNPLSIARTYTGILRENGDADEDVIVEIAQAHDRMENIIEDVLTLAREDESIENTAPVELSAIARDAWAGVHTDEATLRVASDRVIDADEIRLKRLFVNLFQNAVEHGGDDVTVRVGTIDTDADDSGQTGFYVEDDGPGVPDAVGDQIFESAYSTTETGTGFGLPIVRQVARAHGWSVELDDSDAGGARFEVTGVVPVESVAD